MYSVSQQKHLSNFQFVAYFYLTITLLLRIFLFFWSHESFDSLSFLNIIAIGFLFDAKSLVYIIIPWILLGLTILPSKSEVRLRRIYKSTVFVLLTITIATICFTTIAEITFWNEFNARFNFIAVDYLVYTNEVLKNIWESYPVYWVIFIISILTFTISYIIFQKIEFQTEIGMQLKKRMLGLLFLIGAVFLNYFLTIPDTTKNFTYSQKELSKNGLQSLFSAYFENQLDYDRFYITQDLTKSFKIVRERLRNEGQLTNNVLSVGREILAQGEFQRRNVIIISMESMSARFMKAFDSTEDITPNLDRLATQGLFFRNIFSTGTRTVRGLEALILSIPPTPGQSILRRPKNENLYNIGDYFEDAGYETEFLYGGYGYFDNMNAFFGANSFSIWDQATFEKGEIKFENAWGVSDEDLFSKAIQRADYVSEKRKPFFQVIMTTSNHRPYTYPQKIDIPSGSGRSGAVKYADFAIGEFLKQSEKKSWFENTVFIFVADHNASVSGNLAVPITDFRIPLIFYAPKIIQPKVISKLGSQIDVAPTILGLLNAQYNSHFFGNDLLHTNDERAFMGTYQKIGLLRENILTLLGPNKTVEQFQIGANDIQQPLKSIDHKLVDETVSYYQTASFLFRSGRMYDEGDDRIKNWGAK